MFLSFISKLLKANLNGKDETYVKKEVKENRNAFARDWLLKKAKEIE